VNTRLEVAARPSGIANETEVFHIFVRNLTTAGHEEQLATQRRESDVLRGLAGVTGVAKVSQVPLSRSGSTNSVAVSRKQVNETANASFYWSPDALDKVWGMKMVEGRYFTPAETPEIDQNTSRLFPKHVIVTKALAGKMFPDAPSVVGKSIFFGTGEEANEAQIVGVVERLQTQTAQVGIEAEYSTIVPVRLTGNNVNIYSVRAEPGQLDRVMKDAEQALRTSSPNPVIIRMKSMIEERKDRYRGDIAMAWMLVTVSTLLLLITCSGIVGMASLWVTQRRKQIGVRRALGARKADILRYFITENLMITSTGVAAGALLAIGMNQLLVSKLEMARLPVAYLLTGAAVFWLLGFFAVYGPAWRAASISPATATRST
jgi:putative ABC transport system permease protein